MRKTKIFFTWLGILILIILVAGFFGNWYVKKKIKNGLDQEQVSQNLSYEELSVNLLTQNASLGKPVWNSEKFHFQANNLQLRNFDIWNYLVNGIIEVEEFIIQVPELTIYTKASNDSGSQNDEGSQEEESLGVEIKLGRLNIVEGFVQMKAEEGEENDLYMSLLSLNLTGIDLNDATADSKIPFNYEDLTMEIDSIYYDLNPEHSLEVESIVLNGGNLELNDLNIHPEYSKVEHDQAIPYEKDRADVSINFLNFKNFEWEFLNDSLMIASPKVEITGADAEIYRNKLLPDDERIKPMYSEMLRNLGIKLKLDTINIKESSIVYEERTLEERPAGTLKFGDVQATITNLTNVNMDQANFPVTKVDAKANFMEKATLTLNWEFDVSNRQDEFQVNGSFAGINASEINPFLRPVMNVETEGEIESLFYNFYGNKHEASGDMKLAYRDFKISILKEGEGEKKSFLSGLANLILKNDVVDEDVSQKEINVERDKTKSIWNFFWLLIKEGSIKTFL